MQLDRVRDLYNTEEFGRDCCTQGKAPTGAIKYIKPESQQMVKVVFLLLHLSSDGLVRFSHEAVAFYTEQ